MHFSCYKALLWSCTCVFSIVAWLKNGRPHRRWKWQERARKSAIVPYTLIAKAQFWTFKGTTGASFPHTTVSRHIWVLQPACNYQWMSEKGEQDNRLPAKQKRLGEIECYGWVPAGDHPSLRSCGTVTGLLSVLHGNNPCSTLVSFTSLLQDRRLDI